MRQLLLPCFLVAIATAEPLAPFLVVKLEAEFLDALDPAGFLAKLALQRQNEIEHLLSGSLNRLRSSVHSAALTQEIQDSLRRFRLRQHHLASLLLEEEASESEQQLNNDLDILLLLQKQLWKNRGDLRGCKKYHAVRIQGQDAADHNALQHHIVRGKAHHKQPVEQVEEALFAQLRPRHLWTLAVQPSEYAQRLHKHLWALNSCSRETHDLVEPADAIVGRVTLEHR
mmetsp:Transcript_88482/g.189928  ORF Transcript_88482/g.189928 Transcript_88482/m.189928 type:complete len:228 (+) Transcript_88482:151-834(+)